QDPIVPSKRTYEYELVVLPPAIPGADTMHDAKLDQLTGVSIRRYPYSSSPGTSPPEQQVRRFRDRFLHEIKSLPDIYVKLTAASFLAVPFVRPGSETREGGIRRTPGGVLFGFFTPS